mmetsp:Transcript_77681/g.107440  ORF Transcript_77681/g.107440 Transcript_77681/m.107440 type:complete len:209 (+) Transcript_77681:1907-2533(+)
MKARIINSIWKVNNRHAIQSCRQTRLKINLTTRREAALWKTLMLMLMRVELINPTYYNNKTNRNKLSNNNTLTTKSTKTMAHFQNNNIIHSSKAQCTKKTLIILMSLPKIIKFKKKISEENLKYMSNRDKFSTIDQANKFKTIRVIAVEIRVLESSNLHLLLIHLSVSDEKPKASKMASVETKNNCTSRLTITILWFNLMWCCRNLKH